MTKSTRKEREKFIKFLLEKEEIELEDQRYLEIPAYLKPKKLEFEEFREIIKRLFDLEKDLERLEIEREIPF